MQIDVNSTADRMQLMRAQRTSSQTAGLNPNVSVSTDGRAFTVSASAPVTFPELATAPVKTTSEVHEKPSVTRMIPMRRSTIQPENNPGTAAKTTANYPAVPDQQPAEPTSRLEALLEDWGKGHSPYDLDGNGDVGISDLLELLAMMSGESQRPDNPGATVMADPNRQNNTMGEQPRLSVQPDSKPEQPSPLEALLEDWGKSDSPYDLDGNGDVGINDLLLLLAKMGSGPQRPQDLPGDLPAAPSRQSDALGEQVRLSVAPDQKPEPTSRLEALLQDWGKGDSPYDFDGNGNVGISDLLALLAMMSDGGPQQPRPEPHQGPQGDVAGPRQSSAHTLTEAPAQPDAPHHPTVTPTNTASIGVKIATTAQWAANRLNQDNRVAIAPSNGDGSTQTLDPIDRNQDGAVRRSELASTIRDMLMDLLAKNPKANLQKFAQEAMKQLSDHRNANETPGKRTSAVERSSSVYRQANLTATARQLMQGLTDHGAMELRKFVQAGELSASEKRTVLDQISSLRPDAQVVNMVG